MVFQGGLGQQGTVNEGLRRSSAVQRLVVRRLSRLKARAVL